MKRIPGLLSALTLCAVGFATFAPAQQPTGTEAHRMEGAATANGNRASTTSSECCNPEAMKKIAASLVYLDIVGIKLGMSPQEAFTAVKTHNPSLKLDVINARLQHPTAPQGTFVKVPEWVIAHSIRAGVPNSFYEADGSAESIGLEFTTPPNPPLVSKVARYVQFPSGKSVLLGTLLDALHKKYGPENFALNGNLVWVFDANGKQLTRFLTQAEKGCDPGNYVWDFPGQDIRGVSGSDGAISLTENEMEEFNVRYERHLACTPLTFVVATNLDLPPNSPVTQMMVVILSPALLRNSQQATHDWLQAELDGKTKQEDDAAKKRSAPKL